MLSLILIVILTLLLAQASQADCQTTLTKCDTAVNALKTLVNAQGKEISDLKTQSALQQQINKDQASKLNSPLHDPVKVAAATVVIVLVLEIVTGVFKK